MVRLTQWAILLTGVATLETPETAIREQPFKLFFCSQLEGPV